MGVYKEMITDLDELIIHSFNSDEYLMYITYIKDFISYMEYTEHTQVTEFLSTASQDILKMHNTIRGLQTLQSVYFMNTQHMCNTVDNTIKLCGNKVYITGTNVVSEIDGTLYQIGEFRFKIDKTGAKIVEFNFFKPQIIGGINS